MRRFSLLIAFCLFCLLQLTAAVRAEVTIGLAGPMSGRLALLGEQMKRGAELAVADLNAAGGVNGEKINLIVADDECDSEKAIAAANDLVGKGAIFVVGHLCSAASIAAAPIYAKKQIIMISPGSTHPALTDDVRKNDWTTIFRICGRDDAQGAFVGEYIAKHYKDKKFAIVHDDSDYGKALAEQARETVRKYGLEETVFVGYQAGNAQLGEIITKLKANAVQAVFIAGFVKDGAALIKQAHEQDYRPQFMGPDAMIGEDFWKVAGKAGDGTLVAFQFDPRRKPESKALVEKALKAKLPIDFYGFYAYAAVQVWAAAAKEAGSFSAAGTAAKLHSNKFQTVLGTLSFDEKGDVVAPQYVWYVWKDGKYVEK
jgi:branched-chain amino acid transport system substrate-binding protein